MAASASDYFQKVGMSTATTLSAPGYTVGNTSITVASTTNWPTDTGVTFAIDTIDSAGERVDGTYNIFRGTVASATSITNVVYVGGDTNQNYSAGTTTRVYILVSYAQVNRMVDGLLVEHNQDGTHDEALITSRTEDTNPDPDADFVLTYDASATALKKAKLSNLSGGISGWVSNVLPSVSSVTYNGNRSYDVTFASTVASYLTPGMRVRTSRTVAAPTYMGGAFNGTNHYFTKTTCTSTLSTVTNNFTIMGFVEPTSYAAGFIAGRSDSTPNNSLNLKMESDGRVTLGVNNAGVANFRNVTTYQSLPLNKKTHVTASWASGTVVIYFDGVSVPVATAVTGGTAPTTAGTGGDFSIGRLGAYNSTYFTGYLSGFGVFDAVLTAATIKSYSSQVLSGSETNCIGAWSLNNTGVNQQASGTNDLTATNSVSYTARSPYTTDANGTPGGTYDWGIVTKVSTTTATIQVPEGCAIPTSGGVSAVDLCASGVPFGFPGQKDRWDVETILKTDTSQSSAVSATWYNVASIVLSVPVGNWLLGHEVPLSASDATNAPNITTSLSTSSSSESDSRFTSRVGIASVNNTVYGLAKRQNAVSVSSATPYYLVHRSNNGANTCNLNLRGSTEGAVVVRATPNYP